VVEEVKTPVTPKPVIPQPTRKLSKEFNFTWNGMSY